MPVKADLQASFETSERQRNEVQNSVLALSDAQLRWTPDEETWSTLQIVEHLVLSEETVGRAQEPGTVKNEAPMFRVLPRSWRRALILRALRNNKVLPLPSPDVEPHGKVPLPQLLSRWEAAHKETRDLLATMPKDEKRYAHPVLGPLNMAQMLELSQIHTAYHARQMEALRRSPAFPQG